MELAQREYGTSMESQTFFAYITQNNWAHVLVTAGLEFSTMGVKSGGMGCSE